MVEMTHQMKDCLEKNNIYSIGNLLHQNWLLKKRITKGVSDQQIDLWYKKAMDAGALGGKLLGDGHGGFLMFMAEPNKQKKIIDSLSELKNIDISLKITLLLRFLILLYR